LKGRRLYSRGLYESNGARADDTGAAPARIPTPTPSPCRELPP
jgi:hypothetical protein